MTSALAGDATEPEVGAAVLIKNQVTGTLGTAERPIETGARVHLNELIRTGTQAQAELKLDDDTKLALGPDSELRLDEFAVGSANSAPSIGLRFLKGTLRFLTGKSASASYKIETPSATIGVRGTVFDIYVGTSGSTFVLMHMGKVQICVEKQSCQRHSLAGRVVQATALGISKPSKWSANLADGVSVVEAFPFVGRKLAIDPVPRSHHKAISDDLKGR